MGTKRTETRGSGGKLLEVFATSEGVSLRSGLEIWRLTWTQLDQLRPKAAPKAARLKSPLKRATPPPAAFPLTAERVNWANRNLPIGFNISAETAVFLDYYRSTGRSRVNWEASWRNWMRKAVVIASEHAERHPPEQQRRTRTLNEQAEASLAAMVLAGEGDTEEAHELRRKLNGHGTAGRNRPVLARTHA
jgi:hypothetical protein